MFYPAKVERDGDGWLVSFPDIPEALTSGATREEALTMARDALQTAMDFYFEDGRAVPLPSPPARGLNVVELPASVAAKVLLLNEMISQRIKGAELARRMGTSPQEVSRITDLHHATKIDNINAALHALGRRLELRTAPI